MMNKENLKIKESGHIEIRNAKTGELLASSGNLMVTSGLTVLAGALIGTLTLAWCALGTGTTSPVVGQTTLATEVKRLQLTATSAISAIVTVQTFFLAAESTYHIKEIGLFASDSDGTADSGTMFARALIDYDNSSAPVDLVVTWVITLAIGA